MKQEGGLGIQKSMDSNLRMKAIENKLSVVNMSAFGSNVSLTAIECGKLM